MGRLWDGYGTIIRLEHTVPPMRVKSRVKSRVQMIMQLTSEANFSKISEEKQKYYDYS